MRIIALLLTLLLLQSCHLNHTSPPEDLISEDKMVDILYDFMIINSAQGANKKILEIHAWWLDFKSVTLWKKAKESDAFRPMEF